MTFSIRKGDIFLLEETGDSLDGWAGAWLIHIVEPFAKISEEIAPLYLKSHIEEVFEIEYLALTGEHPIMSDPMTRASTLFFPSNRKFRKVDPSLWILGKLLGTATREDLCL